jgi:RNA polymerase sigma-70 factor (ECF subfamily)
MVIRLPFFNCNIELSHCYRPQAACSRCLPLNAIIGAHFCPYTKPALATEQELSDFLKQAEKKAFKRTYYHVRDEDAALDILQDSMIKLSTHYGDKPARELPLLFQRILSNTTLDWFRRQKTRNAHFTTLTDFSAPDGPDDFDLLEVSSGESDQQLGESAEQWTGRLQTMQHIESAVMELPARQREAFLLRYWEELDVAETAAVMGCTEGSVKTHCSRAIQALHRILSARGIQP